MWDEWSVDKVPLHAVLSYYAFSLMTVKTWPEGWRQQSEQTFLAIAQLGSRFYLLNTPMASKHDQRGKMCNALFIKTPFYMEAILCPNREFLLFLLTEYDKVLTKLIFGWLEQHTLFLHSFGIPVGSLATALRASYHCGEEKALSLIGLSMKIPRIILFICLLY